MAANMYGADSHGANKSVNYLAYYEYHQLRNITLSALQCAIADMHSVIPLRM